MTPSRTEDARAIGLVADIGGSNARFAIVGADGVLDGHRSMPTADYATLEDAMRDFIEAQPGPAPTHAMLAVATPIGGDRVEMTNHPWVFSVESLRRSLGLAILAVVNDFVAQAAALEVLTADDVIAIGKPAAPVLASTDDVIAVTGPGTGLGAAALVPLGRGQARRWIPLASQGGHASYAPQDWNEARVVAFARHQFAHVSAERLISGPGLELIHRALHDETCSAAVISEQAQAGDERSRESILCMFGMLGSFAGSLALTLNARAGVFIAGGIVPANRVLLEESRLRQCFEAKGRYSVWLADVPTLAVVGHDVGLRGAAVLTRRLRELDWQPDDLMASGSLVVARKS